MLDHVKNNKITITNCKFDRTKINCNNKVTVIFKEITQTMNERFLKDNIYKGKLSSGHGNKYTKLNFISSDNKELSINRSTRYFLFEIIHNIVNEANKPFYVKYECGGSCFKCKF